MNTKKYSLLAGFAITLTVSLTPETSHACACGCGMFDIGTSSLLPTREGGIAFIEYDFMNQKNNYHGTSSAPSANNDDKDIRTTFITAGAQYMFNGNWGVKAEVPFLQRSVVMDDGMGEESVHSSSVGDIRIRGIYTGLADDMSTGITFGLKLPTGEFKETGLDRDMQIGSGTTDLLLGAYHMGHLPKQWNWFVNTSLDQPLAARNEYRPGTEVNLGSGVYYDGWYIGNVQIAPLAQFIGTYRAHDTGPASSPDNTGYERVLFSPGVEIDTGGSRIYGDVGFPIYQNIRGNQLTAPVLFKLNVSHSF